MEYKKVVVRVFAIMVKLARLPYFRSLRVREAINYTATLFLHSNPNLQQMVVYLLVEID